MSIVDALLAEMTAEQLRQFATRIAPYLPGEADTSGGVRWLRGAPAIAEYIAAPVSRVYALSSQGRIPVCRDGSVLVARTSELDEWMLAGGSRRA